MKQNLIYNTENLEKLDMSTIEAQIGVVDFRVLLQVYKYYK